MAMNDLSRDAKVDISHLLAWNSHGRVGVNRMVGSALSGGGPFENVSISVLMTRADRIERVELFDVADDDDALARFAELCAERE
jgi:hypothetical protein